MRDNFQNLYNKNSQKQQASVIREICNLINQPDMRSMAGGWPAAEVFPVTEVADIAAKLFVKSPELVFQYGSTEGYLPLRQAICDREQKINNCSISSEEIIVLHGSQQGMDLISRVLIGEGDVVLAGLPTYFGGTGAVMAANGQVVGVPVDDDGLDTAILEQKLLEQKRLGKCVKGVYVIPNFQNPKGVCLSIKRREHLLELADTHDFIIFEDDPYGELRFSGNALPSLFKLSKTKRVLHIRSLSKTFAPGLRIAWAAAETGLIRKMVVAKQYVDSCTNSLAQHIICEFISKGHLEKRIEKNIDYYRTKLDHTLSLLDKHLPPEVSYNRPEGGFFVFIELPDKLDAENLLRQAIKEKVVFVIGKAFFIDQSGQNTFRLSYSQSSMEEIKQAIIVLAKLIKQAINSCN